jgi:hypothetical protein
MAATTSILFLTQNPETELLKRWNINLSVPHPDVFIVTDTPSIGIELIRDTIPLLTRPPFILPQKFVIIYPANTLTIEAQNALLKLLEEPPEKILVANTDQTILPTITSRCFTIREIGDTQAPTSPSDVLAPLIALPPAKRPSLIPTIKGKEDTMNYCRQLVDNARTACISNTNPTTTHNLALLAECLTRINQNANPNLALTDTVLQLESMR